MSLPSRRIIVRVRRDRAYEDLPLPSGYRVLATRPRGGCDEVLVTGPGLPNVPEGQEPGWVYPGEFHRMLP